MPTSTAPRSSRTAAFWCSRSTRCTIASALAHATDRELRQRDRSRGHARSDPRRHASGASSAPHRVGGGSCSIRCSPDAMPSAKALAPLAASALGYQLTAPRALAERRRGRRRSCQQQLTLPSRSSHARTASARPRGGATGNHAGVRDLAIRPHVRRERRRLVIGRVFDGAMRAGAVRAAPARLRTDARGGLPRARGQIRRGAQGSGEATISTWMDDGKAGAPEHLALRSSACPPSTRRPIWRRAISRWPAHAPQDRPRSPSPQASRACLLDATRRQRAPPGLPLRDRTATDVARTLARTLGRQTVRAREHRRDRAPGRRRRQRHRGSHPHRADGQERGGAAIARTKEGSSSSPSRARIARSSWCSRRSTRAT